MSKNEFEILMERYHADTCSPEEKAWIENWLLNNQLDQQNHWHSFTPMERQSYINDLFDQITEQVTLAEISPNVINLKKRKRMYALVASCAAIFIASFYLFFNNEKDSASDHLEMTTIEVPNGQRKKVMLTDGTVIYLQGGSKFSYPNQFSKNSREVHLTGEAFFEVNRQEEAPFIVKTKYLSTKVLGTKFHVSAIDELSNTQVYLFEGKLALQSIQQEGIHSKSELILNSNESAKYNNDHNGLTKVKTKIKYTLEELESGTMNFEDERLSEILVKIANNYGISVINKNKNKNILVSGLFKLEDPIRDVIKSITLSTGTKAKWSSAREVIIY